MLTRFKGTLSIPFEVEINHLTPGGESLYIETQCGDPDAIDADHSIEEIQRWHRVAYQKQMALQKALLTQPDALRRLIRYQLLQMLDDLESEKLEDILRLPANENGDMAFFIPDLFSHGFEVYERAGHVLDMMECDLGKPRITLGKREDLVAETPAAPAIVDRATLDLFISK